MGYVQIHKGRGLLILIGIVIAFLAVHLVKALNSQHFENCTQLKAAGIHDIPTSSSFYRPTLDRNKNGIACQT